MREKKFVLIFFFFISLVLTYPSIWHLSDRLIGDGGDNYQYFGFQYIVSTKIASFQLPFSHSNIYRYPVGFNFSHGYDSVLSTIMGAVLSLITNNIIAYNLTILILLTLNGFFSYLFFSCFSPYMAPPIIGAVIYGFSSYVLARTAGHINLMFVGALPLSFYFFLKLIKEKFSSINLILLLAATFLIFLGSFQYALMFLVAILCLFLITFVVDRKKIKTIIDKLIPRWKQIIITIVPFAMIGLIFTIPFLGSIFSQNLVQVNRIVSLREYSPTLTDYFLPNKFLPLFLQKLVINTNYKSIERVVFLGWLEIAFIISFILSRINRRLKLYIITNVAVFFFLSLGSYSHELNLRLPYYFLRNIFPFSYIPEAGRFFIFFYLFLTVGLVLTVNKLWQVINKKSLQILLTIILLSMVLAERLFFKFWLSPTFTDKKYAQVVKKEKGLAVFDIPVDSNFSTSAYNLLPYVYGKKIISGYFHYLANTLESKKFLDQQIINRFVCNHVTNLNLSLYGNNKLNQELIQFLKKNNIYTIVVHKNDPEDHAKYYFPECANTRMQTSILLPQLFMPDPTEKQKVISIFFPAILSQGDTIRFTSDGIFYLDGIQAYPKDWLPLKIYLNSKSVNLVQNWTAKEGDNATVDPYLKLIIKKGDKITFSFTKNNNQGYSLIKLWYRYTIKNNILESVSINGIKKIFEDDDAAVFRIE